MATTIQSPVLTSSLKIIKDTDADGTSEAGVTGASTVIYMIHVDNTLNSAASYLKLYNAAAPTIGTTAPDIIVMAPAASVKTLYIPEGVTFATDLSFACVTTAGTAGTTSPTSDVAVTLVVV